MIRPRTQDRRGHLLDVHSDTLGKIFRNQLSPHKPLNLSTKFRFWAYMQEIPLSWLTWDIQVSRDLGLQCKP